MPRAIQAQAPAAREAPKFRISLPWYLKKNWLRLIAAPPVISMKLDGAFGLKNTGSASARICHKFAASLAFFRATLRSNTDYRETVEKT